MSMPKIGGFRCMEMKFGLVDCVTDGQLEVEIIDEGNGAFCTLATESGPVRMDVSEIAALADFVKTACAEMDAQKPV